LLHELNVAEPRKLKLPPPNVADRLQTKRASFCT
jgi:ABC-type multidrug transport system permease subunit